jgi:hypothetical protein
MEFVEFARKSGGVTLNFIPRKVPYSVKVWSGKFEMDRFKRPLYRQALFWLLSSVGAARPAV